MLLKAPRGRKFLLRFWTMVMVPSIVSSFPKMKDVTMSMFFLAANLYPEVPSE